MCTTANGPKQTTASFARPLSLPPGCRATNQIEDETLAAEAVLRDREAYLSQLYTSFVPLWGKYWEEGSEAPLQGLEAQGERLAAVLGGDPRLEMEEAVGVEGDVDDRHLNANFDDDNVHLDGVDRRDQTNDDGETKQRPTMWWRGADAPHIWTGPRKPGAAPASAGRRRSATTMNGRLTPGARFVPAEQALLDGLEPQAMTVGRLSREYLTLLGLPYESIRDMFQKASAVRLLCCAFGVLRKFRGMGFFAYASTTRKKGGRAPLPIQQSDHNCG